MMTHNTVYSDDSVRACGQIIRTYSTNMHHERTTSAALLSAMLEQDSVPALRSQESGAERPTSTGTQCRAQSEAGRPAPLCARRWLVGCSKERHQKLIWARCTAPERHASSSGVAHGPTHFFAVNSRTVVQIVRSTAWLSKRYHAIIHVS